MLFENEFSGTSRLLFRLRGQLFTQISGGLYPGLRLLFLLFFVQRAIAQQSPADGQVLNYTQVHFHWPDQSGQMSLEVSADSAFRKDVVNVPGLSSPDALVRQGLSVGRHYFWRVISLNEDFSFDTSAVHTFSIGMPRRADSRYFRHEVVVSKLPEYTRLLIAEDKPGVFINLSGEVVWYHPDTNIVRLFDLRQLPDGRIGYLRPKGPKEGNDNLAFEIINREGEVLWRAPDSGEISGDTSEFYHHAWVLRPNGNVVLSGNKFETREVLYQGKKVPMYCKMGTLIEYNPAGEVVWSWKLSDHLSSETLTEAGLSDNPAHLNGFFFDENASQVIISLRYLNLLLLVNYPSGEVVNRWKGSPVVYNDLSVRPAFARQHSPVKVGNEVWMLNNGWGRGADSVTSLVAIRGDLPPDSLQTTRRYPLFFETRANSFAESKGDIDFLGNTRWLVGMGALPRTLLFDTEKGVIWQCEHTRRLDTLAQWGPLEENYRSDWAYDLYPVRFDAELIPTATGFTLRIHNLGRYPEQYRWEWPAASKLLRLWQTPPVEPGERAEIQLPPLKLKKNSARQLVIFTLSNSGETWKIDLSPYE